MARVLRKGGSGLGGLLAKSPACCGSIAREPRQENQKRTQWGSCTSENSEDNIYMPGRQLKRAPVSTR
ncbi:MAG: hypothetical protein IPO58_25150 [Betaproteobacteria bacterium]|nr:hypothetical protein [Betaproteobacteria bacterium]